MKFWFIKYTLIKHRQKNALMFYLKRLEVWTKTPWRFTWNALTFWRKRLDGFTPHFTSPNQPPLFFFFFYFLLSFLLYIVFFYFFFSLLYFSLLYLGPNHIWLSTCYNGVTTLLCSVCFTFDTRLPHFYITFASNLRSVFLLFSFICSTDENSPGHRLL